MTISSPQAEVQKMVFDALTADATVAGLVNGIYDRPPAAAFNEPKLGYISFGPTQALNDDSECIIGDQYTVQLDFWSRQVGFVHVKRMLDAAKRVLQNTTIDLDDNAMVGCIVESMQTLRDPDGLTNRGIMTLIVHVEEATE